MQSVQFTVALNGAGSFQGEVKLSDSRVRAADVMDATTPVRTALYVDRDGVLVWGGIIWTRKYDSTKLTVEFGGAEFWSYFSRRYITAGISHSDEDQLSICSSLLTVAQAAASGNIGVAVNPAGTTSPVLRDLVVYGYEFKEVADAITDFATLDDGFDFAIDVAYDTNGNPAKSWNPGYPHRGRTVAQTGHVFEYPGNIIDYTWNEDGQAQSTSLYVVGAGEGDDMAQSNVQAPDMLQAGYPLVEGQIPVKDTTDPVVLASRAQAEAAALKAAVTIPTIDVRADMDPVLGSYIVGDDVRLRITDPRFPNTLDTFMRITAFTVTPAEPGANTAEAVALTLDRAV